MSLLATKVGIAAGKFDPLCLIPTAFSKGRFCREAYKQIGAAPTGSICAAFLCIRGQDTDLWFSTAHVPDSACKSTLPNGVVSQTGVLSYLDMLTCRRAALLIQRCWRKCLATKHAAATCIQCSFRRSRDQRHWHSLKRAVLVVQVWMQYSQVVKS